MRFLIVPAFAAASFAGLMGCATSLSQTSARTLDKGKTEVTASLGVLAPEQQAYAPPVLPAVLAQVRHGADEHLELGASIGPSGLGARIKVGLIRSESPTSGINVSLEPGASIMVAPWAPVDGFWDLTLPLHIGFLMGGHELTLSPRVGTGGLFSEEQWTPYAGGSIAFAIRMSESFRLTPEVGLAVPLGEGARIPAMPSFSLGFTWGR